MRALRYFENALRHLICNTTDHLWAIDNHPCWSKVDGIHWICTRCTDQETDKDRK